MSDRQIAEQVGSSPTTVGTRREQGEEAGMVSKLDTRLDKRGTKQPAHKPKAPAPAENMPTLVAPSRKLLRETKELAASVLTPAASEDPQALFDEGIAQIESQVANLTKALQGRAPALLTALADALTLMARKTQNAALAEKAGTTVSADHLAATMRRAKAEREQHRINNVMKRRRK